MHSLLFSIEHPGFHICLFHCQLIGSEPTPAGILSNIQWNLIKHFPLVACMLTYLLDKRQTWCKFVTTFLTFSFSSCFPDWFHPIGAIEHIELHSQRQIRGKLVHLIVDYRSRPRTPLSGPSRLALCLLFIFCCCRVLVFHVCLLMKAALFGGCLCECVHSFAHSGHSLWSDIAYSRTRSVSSLWNFLLIGC